MPWLLAGFLSAVGYAVAVKKGWINPLVSSPVVIPVSIDPYMPPALESAVVAQITGNDPNAMMSVANQIVPYFPAAAYSLQHRAWSLMGGTGSGQPEPQPPSMVQMQAAFVAWQAAQAAQLPGAPVAAAPGPAQTAAPPPAPSPSPPAPAPAPVPPPSAVATAPAAATAAPEVAAPVIPPLASAASVNGAASASA